MRQIKFRAWTGVSMVYDAEASGRTLGFVLSRYEDNVMQFTGLEDKNGKEIYEGDIMRWEYEGRIGISFIVWGLDGWRFNSYMPLGRLDLYPYVSATSNIYPKAEVIGNKYENPELLQP